MGYTAQAWSPEAGWRCDVHRDRAAIWRLVEHPNQSIGEPWLALRWACDDCRQEVLRWAGESPSSEDEVLPEPVDGDEIAPDARTASP